MPNLFHVIAVSGWGRTRSWSQLHFAALNTSAVKVDHEQEKRDSLKSQVPKRVLPSTLKERQVFTVACLKYW